MYSVERKVSPFPSLHPILQRSLGISIRTWSLESDYLGATLSLSLEDLGKFLDLLVLQFSHL